MSAQLNIDFTVHARENSAENQKHLDENRKHFSRQCKQVYELLMSGKRLTRLGAANDGIASLERRIKDLKENGVAIQTEWVQVNGRNSYKEYFINK